MSKLLVIVSPIETKSIFILVQYTARLFTSVTDKDTITLTFSFGGDDQGVITLLRHLGTNAIEIQKTNDTNGSLVPLHVIFFGRSDTLIPLEPVVEHFGYIPLNYNRFKCLI